MRNALRLGCSFGKRTLALSVFAVLAVGGAACSHATSSTPATPIGQSNALDGRANTMPPEPAHKAPLAAPAPRATPAPGPMIIQEGREQPESTTPPSTTRAVPPPLPADTGAVYGAPPPPPLPPPKPAEPTAPQPQ